MASPSSPSSTMAPSPTGLVSLLDNIFILKYTILACACGVKQLVLSICDGWIVIGRFLKIANSDSRWNSYPSFYVLDDITAIVWWFNPLPIVLIPLVCIRLAASRVFSVFEKMTFWPLFGSLGIAIMTVGFEQLLRRRLLSVWKPPGTVQRCT